MYWIGHINILNETSGHYSIRHTKTREYRYFTIYNNVEKTGFIRLQHIVSRVTQRDPQGWFGVRGWLLVPDLLVTSSHYLNDRSGTRKRQLLFYLQLLDEARM